MDYIISREHDAAVSGNELDRGPGRSGHIGGSDADSCTGSVNKVAQNCSSVGAISEYGTTRYVTRSSSRGEMLVERRMGSGRLPH